MLRKFVIGLLSFCLGMGVLIGATPSEDSAQIDERLKAFTEAFSSGKIKDIAPLLTQDASFTNPVTGETIDGKEAIAKYLEEKYQTLQGKKVVLGETKIDFPEPDYAVVTGALQIFDKDNLIEKKARKLELVKEDGKWYLDTIREVDVEAPPAPPEELTTLNWLIGNWKDADEDVDITFSTHWDKHKNFIIQRFNTKIYDVEELEGMQIIGWDPNENKIRSWIFDSDGGFGSGTWSKDGNSWNIDVKYTLSDGRQASSVNIYTPGDANSYTYSSIGRDVDGEVLPNIDPVKVIREE